MPSPFLTPTSKTLLRQLVDSSNLEAWNQAWSRFITLYGPAIQAWTRGLCLQPADGDNLVQVVAIKLLKAMIGWETRRWLKSLLEYARKSLQADLEGKNPNRQGTPLRKAQWADDVERDLVKELTREEFARLAVLQERLAGPENLPTWSTSWTVFEELFGPVISRYLLKRGMSGDEAEQRARQLLPALARAMHEVTDADLPRFRSWLYGVVRNAALDCFEDLHRDGYQLSEDEPLARQDFVKQLEQRELLNEAESRVEQQAKSDHWAVYRRVMHDQCSGEVTAREFGITVVNVYKIVSRVKQQVREEITKLEEPASQAHG